MRAEAARRARGRPSSNRIAAGIATGCHASSAGAFTSRGLRREALGELVQIDGSEHRWFEDRSDACTLLVFIDDATGRLMQLQFVSSESTASYFEALRGYLETHGCPVAFYSDKDTVFRIAKPDAKWSGRDAIRPCVG